MNAGWLSGGNRRICLFLLILWIAKPILGQQADHQRTFTNSASQISSAIKQIGDTSKGRLPTLAGFVQQPDQPIERYSKGYFDCSFQIEPQVGGRTTVRAVAKITAWYSDPDSKSSGYRELPSSGRLEMDTLDRLADALYETTHNGKALQPPKPLPLPNGPTNNPNRNLGGASNPGLDLSMHDSPPLHQPIAPVGAPAAANLDSLKANRAADEKQSAELKTYIRNMEEIQHNQSHPNDLAAVKRPKTPVFAKPSETAQILMSADAEDEFQILGLEGAWVHVQISGMSRGWMHRSQLEMPPSFEAPANASGDESKATATFRVAKEETATFRGEWTPLKGKRVRIEWVEPANPSIATSRKEKLVFARSVFLHASESLGNAQSVPDGIVVVFDSVDGGQVAATVANVTALANHSLADSAFWRQCSIDPPESFLDVQKP